MKRDRDVQNGFDGGDKRVCVLGGVVLGASPKCQKMRV